MKQGSAVFYARSFVCCAFYALATPLGKADTQIMMNAAMMMSRLKKFTGMPSRRMCDPFLMLNVG